MVKLSESRTPGSVQPKTFPQVWCMLHFARIHGFIWSARRSCSICGTAICSAVRVCKQSWS